MVRHCAVLGWGDYLNADADLLIAIFAGGQKCLSRAKKPKKRLERNQCMKQDVSYDYSGDRGVPMHRDRQRQPVGNQT